MYPGARPISGPAERQIPQSNRWINRKNKAEQLWRPEGTTLSKPRAEARRALRALAQPWVAYVVHTESQRDGPNPTRIVRSIPVHDAGRVHGTLLETTFVDGVVADSGCTSSLAPFRAATLWLPLVCSAYPGRRQRSLRSRCLALGFDRAVASRLSSANRSINASVTPGVAFSTNSRCVSPILPCHQSKCHQPVGAEVFDTAPDPAECQSSAV